LRSLKRPKIKRQTGNGLPFCMSCIYLLLSQSLT